MREPALGLKTSLLNGGSFLKRIRENLLSVWRLPWAPLPAAHAPIHLLDERRTRTAPAAQFGSTLLHMLVFVALLWSLSQSRIISDPPSRPVLGQLPPVPKWLFAADAGTLGKSGNSGGHDVLPPSAGQLAPAARFALTAPHLPDSRPHPLMVPVTISEPYAPEFVRSPDEIGLPWMSSKNNSEGTGDDGIGTGKDHGMGAGPGDGVGVGKDAGPYGPVATQVICRLCPDPLYSEEARKTKLQGSVMLSVLVGADGRVKDVRVIHGLGMGLDENAMQAVRNWQFLPAKDAAQRPVASWISVETMFRLF
jgi:periplasmic protein TonB